MRLEIKAGWFMITGTHACSRYLVAEGFSKKGDIVRE